jgi:hypothetical protein
MLSRSDGVRAEPRGSRCSLARRLRTTHTQREESNPFVHEADEAGEGPRRRERAEVVEPYLVERI